jgi:hypothetical protein
MVTYMLLIIASDFVSEIAPQKAPQTMGQLQTQSPTQSQPIDRSSEHPSDRPTQKTPSLNCDRPSPLTPIALHCIQDCTEMLPDTAACTSPNGHSAFEANARSR